MKSTLVPAAQGMGQWVAPQGPGNDWGGPAQHLPTPATTCIFRSEGCVSATRGYAMKPYNHYARVKNYRSKAARYGKEGAREIL